MTDSTNDNGNTKLITLKKFFIFNSKFGSTEGEEKNKIVFYHPSENELDTKIKDIGLCEAIVKFTSTFTSEENVYCMRTQKSLEVFFQPEKDFWMVLVVNAPSERKTRDGTEYTEYKCDDAHEAVYLDILKQSYYMYRLFNGTFQNNLVEIEDTKDTEQPINGLKNMNFFAKYVLTLKTRNCDILDICRSLQYLPLSKFQFLRVHNFIQMIESTFSAIEHCVFLFNEQLVWSGINPKDLYSIYEYLTGSLFPKYASDDLLVGGSFTRSYSNGLDSQYGVYLTGPTTHGDKCKKAPTVFIYNDGQCQTYKMIVYNVLSATLCLFVKDKKTLTDEFYEEVHTFMGPQLTNIASDIGESLSKESTSANKSLICSSLMSSSSSINDDSAQTTKYLFLNELNCQHNGTIHLEQKPYKKKRSIPRDVMNLLNDLYTQNSKNPNACEIVMKTLSDYWIVRRSTNWRHSFIIFNKNATLLEIADEANKIFDSHLNNVFNHI